MVIDAGRIKHLGDLMHKSIASNGTAVTSNWRLSADGLTNVVWSPESPAGGVSYGSNANDIGNPSAPGASNSVSRADHVHRGVRSVSHASNTYYGDITLETEGGLYIVKPSANTYRLGSTSGGAGSGLTVEEADGSPTDSAITKIKFPNGTLSIAGHVATYTPAASGSHTYVGYDTVGGSFEAIGANVQYMKKITLATAGTLVGISIHVKVPTATDVTHLQPGLWTDDSGVPRLVIADGADSGVVSFKVGNPARWLHLPLGYTPVAAGDYWIGFACINNPTSSMHIAYDAGSDRTITVGPYVLDADYAAQTDSTKSYSIRASFVT